jgi:DUF4097 and DUF4098 domain-containing protein YvlB
MALSCDTAGWDDEPVNDVPTLRPVVRVALSSGSITVVGEDRTDVVVDRGHTEIGSDGDVHVTAKPSSSVEVRCPAGADVMAGTSSGSIHFTGRLGHVRATASSGKVTVEHAADADLRSSSGSLRVERCDGAVRAATGSGSVRVGSAGAVDARVVSGRVDVTGRDVSVRGVSSTVEACTTGGDVEVATVSGQVTVTVPVGVHPHVHVHAVKRPHIEVDQGEDLRISVRTVSGRVTVRTS